MRWIRPYWSAAARSPGFRGGVRGPLLPPRAGRADRSAAARRQRGGAVNPLLATLFVAVTAFVLLLLLLPRPETRSREAADLPLTMLVAAGLRSPVETILEQYLEETGVRVETQYGGSNMLLNNLRVNRHWQPDLYLAADSFYTAQAVESGLAQEVIPLGRQEPVVVFRRAAPPRASSWRELLAANLRWSLADPEQAAIGRATRRLLAALPGTQSGTEETLWAQLEAQTVRAGVFKLTVQEVANDVKVGAVDLGVIWDSTLASPEHRDVLSGLRFADLQESAGQEEIGDLVSVAVLSRSSRPTAALRLARYLGAADRGLPVFASLGLRAVEGDAWAQTPEISLLCGTVDGAALAPEIDAFQRREGVLVHAAFDDCRNLTSKLTASEAGRLPAGFPDVFLACDRQDVDRVRNGFEFGEESGVAPLAGVARTSRHKQLARRLARRLERAREELARTGFEFPRPTGKDAP